MAITILGLKCVFETETNLPRYHFKAVSNLSANKRTSLLVVNRALSRLLLLDSELEATLLARFLGRVLANAVILTRSDDAGEDCVHERHEDNSPSETVQSRGDSSINVFVLKGITGLDVGSSRKSCSDSREDEREESGRTGNKPSRAEVTTNERSKESNDIEKDRNKVEGELETSHVEELVSLERKAKVRLVNVKVAAQIERVIRSVASAVDERAGVLDVTALLVAAQTIHGPARDRIRGISDITSIGGKPVPLVQHIAVRLDTSKQNEEQQKGAAHQKKDGY